MIKALMGQQQQQQQQQQNMDLDEDESLFIISHGLRQWWT